MINKKKLLLTGAGLVAVSIVFIFTFNIVVNKHDSISNTSEHLNCTQLRRVIDNLNRPTLSQLPEIVHDNIEWIRVRDFSCQLNGKNWQLKEGVIITTQSTRPILGDESNILDDFK